MFYFPGYTSWCQAPRLSLEVIGFPHSEIYGLTVVWHLPVAYRRQTASFIVFRSQGIHPMLLDFLLGNLKTTIICLRKDYSSLRLLLYNFILFKFSNIGRSERKNRFLKRPKKTLYSSVILADLVSDFLTYFCVGISIYEAEIMSTFFALGRSWGEKINEKQPFRAALLYHKKEMC